LERSKYHKHIHKARSNPEKYLTIILDGMDQQKSAVPLLAKESKSVQGLWRLRTHITGAIVHTASPHGRKVYAYVDYLQWPHDSNLTINILEDILSKWSGSTLPEVLYLQLDNCYRENKNRFLFGYCSLLVELNIFRKVRINFLHVGHTHADCDQFFSRISPYITKHGAESLQDLSSKLQQCYTPNPEVNILDTVYNYKEILDDILYPISGHSKPLCFKFQKHRDQCLLDYRETSSDVWKRVEDPLIKITPVISGTPDIVQPSTTKMEMAHLQHDIPKWLPWLHEAAAEEWKRFLQQPLEEGTREWGLPILLSKKQTPKPQAQQMTSEAGVLLQGTRKRAVVSSIDLWFNQRCPCICTANLYRVIRGNLEQSLYLLP
jgi:hypothetical protein